MNAPYDMNAPRERRRCRLISESTGRRGGGLAACLAVFKCDWEAETVGREFTAI